MTLRQKIRLSNILMVLIPIVISTAVVFLAAKTSMGSYWHTLENMYLNENGIQSAQSLIYTYKTELWEKDWEHAVFDPNENMTQLERKLAEMGYYIFIKMNGEELYSTVSAEDMQAAKAVAGEALSTAKTLTASLEGVSVIKYTFYRGENTCSIIAVNNGNEGQNEQSYLQSYILRYIALFCVLFLLLILIVNVALSWWISTSVLRPLQRLSAGAREIRDGNLNHNIEYQGNDEFGSVCQDFNEMREYLKQSVEQQLEYEKRRRELITGVSHDLRTPLTSIKGYLDGLMEGIAATPQMQRRYLKAMKVRTEDLERLVESLSTYNRLEHDEFCYHLQQGDFKAFLEQYLEENRAQHENDHVAVEFQCEGDFYPVLMDGSEWKRVLDNLFTNTVRYRQKNTSMVMVSLSKLEHQFEAKLVFADDGPGVPDESLERIFDSFYRIDWARTHSGAGSGIGLAVVMEIVKRHGGNVRAENHNGLTIIMTIPMQEEEV